MQYQELPQLNEEVSKICLGTMTWGQQNTESEAHEQMDMALSEGVNFWDTAEMYPSPPDKDKQGDTERFMGTWFNKTKQRNKVILAISIFISCIGLNAKPTFLVSLVIPKRWQRNH